jgi:hypothetical protein
MFLTCVSHVRKRLQPGNSLQELSNTRVNLLIRHSDWEVGSQGQKGYLSRRSIEADKTAILTGLRLTHQASITKMQLYETFTVVCNAQGRHEKKPSFKV